MAALVLMTFMEDLITLIVFIRSHKLQFAYFIFFLPYLVGFLSFLFPLLLTTCLFLLLFLTIDGFSISSSLAIPGFMGKTTTALLHSLNHNMVIEADHCHGEVGDAAGFLDSIFIDLNSSTKQEAAEEEEEEEGKEVFEKAILPNSGGMIRWEEFQAIGKLYKAILMSQQVGEYPIKLAIQNLNKRQLSSISQHSEGWVTPTLDLDNKSDQLVELIKLDKDIGRKISHNAVGFGEFGSKREIEWKRTLSCRLYEERWSTGGLLGDEQGMDFLWEVANDAEVEKTKKTRKDEDEDDQDNKMKKNGKEDEKNTKKKKTKMNAKDEETLMKDDKDQEEEMVGQFCCLQALKFSRGGMRFGAGKMSSKLVKVTKILKTSFRFFDTKARTT